MRKNNTATSGKLIKAVYALYVYVLCIFCTSYSGRLEYNSLFVGLGGWSVRCNELTNLPTSVKGKNIWNYISTVMKTFLSRCLNVSLLTWRIW